jgi:anhydro-N-acetylmuramic acid kinase
MSGSSLDGLDLALSTFSLSPDGRRVTNWRILAAETLAYPLNWRERLTESVNLSVPEFLQLHAELGDYVGEAATKFLGKHPDVSVSLTGYHGHTTHHDPERGYSLQLGDGARIAARTGLPTVTDLRTADLAAGGQGAPLAPVADLHLFPDHTGFVNLGGIANISLRRNDGSFVAGDVSGCCQVLDRLARQAGHDYDAGGELARSGSVRSELTAQLDEIRYHHREYPKSLGNDWVRETLWPVVADFPAAVADRLHTFSDWLAKRIVVDLGRLRGEGRRGAGAVLVTGGGSHNHFLLERLMTRGEREGIEFERADDTVADFKEAALIALCALLRVAGGVNSLASATGARHDTVNGALYAPQPY